MIFINHLQRCDSGARHLDLVPQLFYDSLRCELIEELVIYNQHHLRIFLQQALCFAIGSLTRSFH